MYYRKNDGQHHEAALLAALIIIIGWVANFILTGIDLFVAIDANTLNQLGVFWWFQALGIFLWPVGFITGYIALFMLI